MQRSPRTALAWLAGLALGLVMPVAGAAPAAGTWEVISLPWQPGEVLAPSAVAADAAGNVYVGDTAPQGDGQPSTALTAGRLQMRDPQGRWTVLAGPGSGVGQLWKPRSLAVDREGRLYVSDLAGGGRIQVRDAEGRWSVLATPDWGDVSHLGLAVDGKGSLYVAAGADPFRYDSSRRPDRLWRRDAGGKWTVLADYGSDPGSVRYPLGLAADPEGNLYVADYDRIQKRDVSGHWTQLAGLGREAGQVRGSAALALDSVGGLYVCETRYWNERIYPLRLQRLDPQGGWSLVATLERDRNDWGTGYRAMAAGPGGALYLTEESDHGALRRGEPGGQWSVVAARGEAPGQVYLPTDVAVDAQGNLYVSERDPLNGGRVHRRDPQGNWSLAVAAGEAGGPGDNLEALEVADDGTLFLASWVSEGQGRIRRRDPQGVWTTLEDTERYVEDLALGLDGRLYAAETVTLRVYDPSGASTEVPRPEGLEAEDWALAVTAEPSGIQVAGLDGVFGRGPNGNWTALAAPQGCPEAGGHVEVVRSLAADRAGTEYAVVGAYGMSVGCLPPRLLRRTGGGAWETLTGSGSGPGEVGWVGGVAVDRLGRVYIADTGNSRVQRFTPWPSGDLNGDGRADVRDVVQAIQVLAGLRPAEPGEVEAADSDLNGRLEAADVVVLLRRLLDA